MGRYVEKILGKKGRYRFVLVVLAVVVGMLSWAATADRQMSMKPADDAQMQFGDRSARLQIPLYANAGEKESVRSVLNRPEDGVIAVATSADLYLDTDQEHRRAMSEGDWPHIGQEFGYSLTSGRWAEKPGEVVVAGESDLSEGETVTGLGGNVKLTVVGKAEYRFLPGLERLLAFPGTWNTIDPAVADISAAAISTTLYSSAITNREALEEYVYSHLDEETAAQLESLDGDTLGAGFVPRSFVEDRPHLGIADQYSFVFGVFALLLPMSLVAFLWAWSKKLLAPVNNQLYTLGVNPAPLWKATFRKIGLAVALASVLGMALGVGVAWLLAPALADLVGIQGPGQQIPTKWLAVIAVGVIVSFIAGGIITRPRVSRSVAVGTSADRAQRVFSSKKLLWGTGAAAVLTLVGVGAASVQLGIDVLETWAPLPVAVWSLFLSLAITGYVSRKSPIKPRPLAQRLSTYHRALTVFAIALLSVAIGNLMFSSTFAQSITAAENKSLISPLPEDQFGVDQEHPNGLKVSQKTVNDLAHKLGLKEPVAVTSTGGQFDIIEGVFGSYGISAVDDTDDLGRILGRALSSEEAATLDKGGLLVRDSAFLDGSEARVFSESLPDGELLPAVQADFGAHWEANAAAFMLTKTAKEHRLSLEGLRWVFTDLSESQQKELLAGALESRISRDLLQVPLKQEASTPSNVYFSLASALIGSCVIVIMVSRTNAKSLEALNSTFWTLGLPASWQRWVLRWSIGSIAVKAFVLGLITGLGTAALISQLMGDVLPFTIDWMTILYAAAALVLGSIVGLLIVGLSSRKNNAHA